MDKVFAVRFNHAKRILPVAAIVDSPLMISICIPAYEMGGEGARFLSRSLEAIRLQLFTDHETVVSDHSSDHKIEEVCAGFPKVRYVRNSRHRGKSSANLNNAIDHASGDLIKVVFQDDFLAGPGSLGRIAERIGDKDWLVHSYWHTDLSGGPRFLPYQPFVPDRSAQILGCNTIGAPTAIAFKKCALRFDQNLRWKMDCEFYYRLLRAFGRPSIVSEPLAVQTVWPGQLTHKLSAAVKTWESLYVQRKTLQEWFCR
jgi:glycosyltransferase involved in cell wall biosynthesis